MPMPSYIHQLFSAEQCQDLLCSHCCQALCMNFFTHRDVRISTRGMLAASWYRGTLSPQTTFYPCRRQSRPTPHPLCALERWKKHGC